MSILCRKGITAYRCESIETRNVDHSWISQCTAMDSAGIWEMQGHSGRPPTPYHANDLHISLLTNPQITFTPIKTPPFYFVPFQMYTLNVTKRNAGVRRFKICKNDCFSVISLTCTLYTKGRDLFRQFLSI